jgi:hypothetical protein
MPRREPATAARDLRIAAGAAAVATAGDFGLLWASNEIALGLRPLGTPALLAATHAGALAIPLYARGYRAAASGLPAADRDAVARHGAYGAALGAAIHLATGLVVHFQRTSGNPPADAYAAVVPFVPWLGPLWAVALVVTTVASLRWARPVARGATGYPRVLALVNPLFVVAALSLAGAASAWGRAFVVPMSPNIAHVLFFAALAAGRRS